jgi:hypothetical protein
MSIEEDKTGTLSQAVSSSHRRALSVRLRLLEEASTQLLELFRSTDGILLTRQGLPGEKRDAVVLQTDRLRALIARAKLDLSLETARRDAAREADAVITAMTVNIEETHPRYLKGYGPISPPLEEYLTNLVSGLLGIMREVRRALGKSESAGIEP